MPILDNLNLYFISDLITCHETSKKLSEKCKNLTKINPWIIFGQYITDNEKSQKLIFQIYIFKNIDALLYK